MTNAFRLSRISAALIATLAFMHAEVALGAAWEPDRVALACHDGESIETELMLAKRIHFVDQRREISAELATTLKELYSGSRQRAYVLSAGAALAFAAITYEGMSLLAAGGTQWAAKILYGSSLKKLIAGEIAYDSAKLVLIEKIAALRRPKAIKGIGKIGNTPLNELLPRVLQLSPQGLEHAFEQIGREHALLESIQQAATPEPRSRRNVLALGWDDAIDFRTLFEIAAAKNRLYELELGLSRHLLNELRSRCRRGAAGAGMLLSTSPAVPRPTWGLAAPAVSDNQIKVLADLPLYSASDSGTAEVAISH